MIIQGNFNDAISQVDHYEFEVNGNKSVHFTLLEGEFQHFFVVVKNPCGKVCAVLSYKTRVKTYCLTNCCSTCSNNMFATELIDGLWSIDVVRTCPIKNGYKLSIEFDLGTLIEEGVNPYAIDNAHIYNLRCGWYKGDLHLHSFYTDGRISLEEIDEACVSKKMDFIAMTEHSTFTTKYPKCDYPIIPATEITWDDYGHYNCFGLKGPIDYSIFIANTKTKNDALNMMFQYLSKQGAVLSINHPFPYGWLLKHNYDIQSFSNIEVINAPHLFPKEIDNDKAIRFFDYLWNNNILLFAVGGSDAHKHNYFSTYPVGLPTTKLYCNGLSIDHMLSAIKHGNSYIEYLTEFEINMYKKDDSKSIVLPGSYVNGNVTINARCLKKVKWQLIKNGNMLFECEGNSFRSDVEIKENDYYRLQAFLENEIVFFANPIHCKERIEESMMFQEILNKFEK